MVGMVYTARNLLAGVFVDDREYVKGIAHVCEALLKNAAKSYGIHFDVVNEVMLETEKRARALGMTRRDLYPDEKR